MVTSRPFGLDLGPLGAFAVSEKDAHVSIWPRGLVCLAARVGPLARTLCGEAPTLAKFLETKRQPNTAVSRLTPGTIGKMWKSQKGSFRGKRIIGDPTSLFVYKMVDPFLGC